MSQTELCPWCQQYIQVELGVQPCPQCHRPIRVLTDLPVIDGKMIGLFLRLLGVKL